MPLVISPGDLGSLAMPDFCPACFWIQRHLSDIPFKIPMPGVFSSIDSYVKNVVHRHFDTHGALPDWFPDLGSVLAYEAGMHWSKFKAVHEETGATLRGTPDDLFRVARGGYHIVDYKTARLTRAQDTLFPKYEVQLNGYAYIASRLGKGPVEGLTLVYLDPDTDVDRSPGLLERSDTTLKLGFTLKVRTVDMRPASFVESLLAEAASIDEQPAAPAHADHCRNSPLLDDLLRLAARP